MYIPSTNVWFKNNEHTQGLISCSPLTSNIAVKCEIWRLVKFAISTITYFPVMAMTFEPESISSKHQEAFLCRWPQVGIRCGFEKHKILSKSIPVWLRTQNPPTLDRLNIVSLMLIVTVPCWVSSQCPVVPIFPCLAATAGKERKRLLKKCKSVLLFI